MRNRLAESTSPYLLQHRDNPVHWQPWDAEALARAKAEDKPILLSVGYAACHWCHVMAHESFENPAIAALMNERFVNIKVDREERPDLDAIYMNALHLLGQQGGWPLTMFLTPEGEPFWGGTYFPPEPRYGRAGFPQILEAVARIWREERDKVTHNTAALVQGLQQLARPQGGDVPSPELGLAAARRLLQEFDTVNGGLGTAPKFPQAPILDLLWRNALLSGDEALRHAVLHTLGRICQGGIYDHLGGGFARYAVDAIWLVPHFEKMLYDNAQLVGLLADAWADSGDPLFAARAAETVDWLEREMLVGGGGFASSLDADSEGEEGRFYVWDAAEIDALLGPKDAERFKPAYGVRAGGNWEGKNVLNRLHRPGLGDDGEEGALARMRGVLFEARERRVRPGRDDKVLADWNGLTIAALAEAAATFDRPGWLELARRAFAFIETEMTGGDGRLFHSWREGRRLELAFLDDYAHMTRAALALFEQTAEPAYLERAEAWAAVVESDYRDAAGGGYFMTADSASDVLVRAKNAHDGPVPAGNAVMLGALARLACLTGRSGHRERAEALARAFAGEAARNPFAHAGLLSANLLLQRPVQVVLIGAPDEPGHAALRRAAFGHSVPERVLQELRPGRDLPPDHPATGKGRVGDRPTAYVCVGPVCQLPVTEPEALSDALAPASLRRSSGFDIN
ncbi:MAG TPA: thioredoxin domain-containing protein [Geminicoccaceae bacterium]|nr:thioredoxin domain-containing protein [Geminicoccaceae bacterium]